MLWGMSFSQTCFLTEQQLNRLHRRFGHPTARRLLELLQRAEIDEEGDKEALEQLTKFCEHCQKHSKSPGRFKFKLPDKDLQFNHTIVVDVMYLDVSAERARPVLHVIDEATRYQAGRFLADMSAKTAWETLRQCWIDCYLGPPERIVHDAGLNFASEEFRANATSMSISTKMAPVEAHWSVGLIEKAHASLRRCFEVISADLAEDLPPKEALLSMSFKAVNDSTGPGGLIPTFLVYGAFPE